MATVVDEYKHEQKKINHVFHYTSRFTDLQKIIKVGFLPSYCKEELDSVKYLSPMVSFCNIPITEVDKYMRYGKNGIGMSIKWAIDNKVNPVFYIHEGSPYRHLTFANALKNNNTKGTGNTAYNSMLTEITTQLLQNSKYWLTEYKGAKINTYQEREWRYVPEIENKKNRIIDSVLDAKEYDTYTDKSTKKPHLPNHPIDITSIADIKYIVVSQDNQRIKIIDTLKSVFGKDITTNALLNGEIAILTASQIRNDF